MSERHAKLIRNGVVIPVTLIGDDYNQVVEAGIVQLSRSPSREADMVNIDAQSTHLKVDGLSKGGFQRIVVTDDNGSQILYQATK